MDQKTPFLVLKNASKDYFIAKKSFRAVNSVSISFDMGEFTVILGPSGSGKTTLLNLIGGLDRLTDGDFYVDGLSTKAFKDRDWDKYRNQRIGFIFQNYDLIPHQNVLQNVSLPLKYAGVKRVERERRAKEALERVGLADVWKKKPNQLSGGQMQRVAIARAMVNHPDLILADEPTGALDSETATQVLDLIKNAFHGKTVILVTHDEGIAAKYADRIIRMKDGAVIADSKPLNLDSFLEKNEGFAKKNKFSFTPLLTSFASSCSNLLTKKTRSIITAIACSVGIVGVALVLATTNGFSSYVNRVETSVATSVPISISPMVYSVRTTGSYRGAAFPNDATVHAYNTSTDYYASHQNKFSSEYMNYLNRLMDDPTCSAYGSAMSILYNRVDLDFHFLTHNGGTEGSNGTGLGNDVIHINQYQSAGSLGSAIGSVTGLPTTILHELYGEEKKMASLYEVIDGKFPTSKDELALIVDKYNRIDYSTLRSLGIYPSGRKFSDLSEEEKSISFSDLLYSGEGDSSYKEYCAFINSDYFDTENPVRTMRDSYEINGYDENTHLFSGDVVQKETVKYNPRAASLNEAFASDQAIRCKIVGVLRPTRESYITLMPTSLAYTTALKEAMVQDYAPAQPGVPAGPSYQMGVDQANNWIIPVNATDESKDGLAVLNQASVRVFSQIQSGTFTVSSTSITNLFDNVFNYFSATENYYTWVASSFFPWCRKVGADFDYSDVVIYPYDTSAGLRDWSLLLTNPAFYDGLAIEYLAYLNSYSLITSILIFPAGLSSKEALRSYLDSWNDGKLDEDCIQYSDIMYEVTSSLGTMIQVISIVLIAFAAISLVVSGVMTAIITYVSVMERTKEIGIMRACGARKRDVGRLFEAECAIIGGVAGTIGVLVGLLLCLPINYFLDHSFPGNGLNSIAALNGWHALALIGVAIVLALLSGLIPSRIAAKRDPVTCLRSE